MTAPREHVILGVDPGFARFGWAALSPDGARYLDAGVIRTQREDDGSSVCEDNARRTRAIGRALREIFGRYAVRLICAESFQHVRQASVSAKVALAWGALITTADEQRISIHHVAPMAIKLAVARDRSASKNDVAFEVRKRIGDLDPILDGKGIRPPLFEHAYDAAAAALAYTAPHGVAA